MSTSAPFAPFAALIKKRFDEMAKGELFIAGGDYGFVWDMYLASYPEGTNSIYRTRTENDCSCCRQFVKNVGNVVSVGTDGKLMSVWDIKGAEYPYDEVSAAMSKFIKEMPITALYRVSEKKYGELITYERLADGNTQPWNHFHAVVPDKFFSDTVGKDRGDYGTQVHVFKRGLTELTATAIDTVIDLVQSDSIYRGTEHMGPIKAFQKLQTEYLKLPEDQRQQYIWTNAGQPAAKFRNTAIGSLIVDLSGTPAAKDTKDAEAKPPIALEDAVKMFESKVAPENYKRTTALITPNMIKNAMATIDEQGVRPSLDRRHAKLSDISVNNVLWVDNSIQSKMKDGLEGLLMAAVAAPKAPTPENAETISIDDFLAKILPQASSLEILVKNSMQRNFMSLTAPVHADAPSIFKWDNNFGWSYDGNITDSALRQRVQSAGGRVDGVLRFSHTWNYDERNASLMDLHVFMPGSTKHSDGDHDRYPSGARVGWNCRTDNASGGKQDVDYTSAAPAGYIPVENITFPDMHKLKDGLYTFKVHNWQLREPTKGGFKAEVEFAGNLFQYDHPKPLRHKEWITLAEATLKNGQFTIEHKHAVGASSQGKWNVKTETFIKVNTLMKSPNHWDGNQTGQKHWFFILENCLNDEPTRGIYNEFLKPELDKHRKVFEILGDKTKCAPADEQLSGVGFATTKGESVLVNVTGAKLRKTYNITF